ncbi:hypothetical protein ACWKWP_16400 [Agromyces soli]
MNEAVAVAEERRRLADDEARIAKLTNETIVNLAQQGLTNGDIATVLGLTPPASRRSFRIVPHGCGVKGTRAGR